MELRGEYRVDTTIKMTPKHIATLARPAPRVYILSGIVFAGGFLCRRAQRQTARSVAAPQAAPASAEPDLLVRQQRPGQMRGIPKPFAPRHPLSQRQVSEGAREDPAPKPRSLACFERRKPPLGAVFLVFDLHRALLGAG